MLKYLNPLLYLKWFGQFIYAWGMSLPWSNAPKTIPALALLLALGVASVIARGGSTIDWRTSLLKKQLATAFETDDFDTAELLLNRQVAERPGDSDIQYRLALIQNEQEKTDEAVSRMQLLVATKRHKEAARWIIQQKYNKKKWNDLSDSDKVEFGDLAKLMYDEYPGDVGIQNLYADYLLAKGDFVKSLDILDELSHVQPIRGLQAAAVARRLGDEKRANRIAKRSLDKMSVMADEDPTNIAVALAVAQNQLFLKRFTDAIRTLDKAIKLAKTNQDRVLARRAFGDSMVAYVRHIESSSEGTISDRIKVLEMMQVALVNSPKNPRVLTMISNQILATLNEDSEQIAAIRKALVKGVSPGVAHFIKGTAALMKNDHEIASRELKLANEHMPLSSAVMNNLAVVLTRNPDVDLEQPLKIINEAIKLSNSSPPHFYETRGQILMLMDRYEEAIPDLERALRVPSLEKKAHLDLAICFDKVGDTVMAEEHRQAAEDFEETQAKKKEAAEARAKIEADAATDEADSEEGESEESESEGTDSEEGDSDTKPDDVPFES